MVTQVCVTHMMVVPLTTTYSEKILVLTIPTCTVPLTKEGVDWEENASKNCPAAITLHNDLQMYYTVCRGINCAKLIANITILEKTNHCYRYIGVWVN